MRTRLATHAHGSSAELQEQVPDKATFARYLSAIMLIGLLSTRLSDVVSRLSFDPN